MRVAGVILTLAILWTTAATVQAATFATSSINSQPLADGFLPYQQTTPIPLAGYGLMDIHGVRMVSLYGHLYDHPAAQAQYALRNLDAYRITHTYRYLARARSNASRLITNRVVSAEGAWFFPYRFNFACCQGDTTMPLRAPWYSALAQGQALSAFVRLFQVTGSPAWLVAADATFASFLVATSADQPWVSWVDADGHLWLEEYPRWPVETSERVLNGQIFAAFGVYDYLQLLRNPQVRQQFLTGRPAQVSRIFDGAVTTAEQTFPRFRQPGAPALYSLEHGISAPSYQSVVIAQYYCLENLTARIVDDEIALTLYSDYPNRSSYTGFSRCPHF